MALSKFKRACKSAPSLDLFQRVLHAELSSAGIAFLVSMVGQHASIVLLKRVAKLREAKAEGT